MSFKPFSEEYEFEEGVLVEDFPSYLVEPVFTWIYKTMMSCGLLRISSGLDRTQHLTQSFRHSLQLDFRESFPDDWTNFIGFVRSSTARTCNFIAYLLQGFCDGRMAATLEAVLRQGSSAYTVEKVDKKAPSHVVGVYDLAYYVPGVVSKAADKALSANEILLSAWNNCYRLKPNYADCVSESGDFMEGYLRDTYWPSEQRTPSISTIVKRLKEDPNILKFKGDTFLKDRSKLVGLLDGIAAIRGQHKTGTGRAPTKNEAEYILNTTIYIWNLMRKTND